MILFINLATPVLAEGSRSQLTQGLGSFVDFLFNAVNQ